MSESIYEVVTARRWIRDDGATASIYGALPYRGEADKARWKIQEIGFTIFNTRSNTYGIGRAPFATRAEADEWVISQSR